MLRGMFAFVIYDTKTKELFGARDFYGIKPLYYYKQDKEFLQTHPENRELLEKRIRRHEKDIAEYVSSDSFQTILNCYNI